MKTCFFTNRTGPAESAPPDLRPPLSRSRIEDSPVPAAPSNSRQGGTTLLISTTPRLNERLQFHLVAAHPGPRSIVDSNEKQIFSVAIRNKLYVIVLLSFTPEAPFTRWLTLPPSVSGPQTTGDEFKPWPWSTRKHQCRTPSRIARHHIILRSLAAKPNIEAGRILIATVNCTPIYSPIKPPFPPPRGHPLGAGLGGVPVPWPPRGNLAAGHPGTGSDWRGFPDGQPGGNQP